eukprot:761805-Hanusia_phi.AAC.1
MEPVYFPERFERFAPTSLCPHSLFGRSLLRVCCGQGPDSLMDVEKQISFHAQTPHACHQPSAASQSHNQDVEECASGEMKDWFSRKQVKHQRPPQEQNSLQHHPLKHEEAAEKEDLSLEHRSALDFGPK